MERRKFLVGLGSATAGSTALIGSGAFTTASIPDRQLTVSVDEDHKSIISLKPGDDPDVFINSEGELQMDFGGEDSEGVNINSRYTWGDPNNPQNKHAFKLQNKDEKSYMVKMNYYFDDPSWIESTSDGVGNGQSFVSFQLFTDRPSSSSRTYPDQRNGYNRDHSLAQPEGSGFGSNTGSYRFQPGEQYYMVVSIDTTGDRAELDDEPSGTAHFTIAESTSADSWDPRSPPN